VRGKLIFSPTCRRAASIFSPDAPAINGGKADAVTAAASRMKEPRLAAAKVDG